MKTTCLHCWLRFLDWLSMQAFLFSQWLQHKTIGEKVLQAYRQRSPEAAQLLLERYRLLSDISPEFSALDMMASMHRQMVREKERQQIIKP